MSNAIVKNEFILIQTALDNEQDGLKIARLLVETKLAACVQLSTKLTSVYKWEGAIHEAKEFLMEIKTTQKNYADVESFLLKHHPYQLPEIVGIPIVSGSKKYLDWLADEVGCVR